MEVEAIIMLEITDRCNESMFGEAMVNREFIKEFAVLVQKAKLPQNILPNDYCILANPKI